MEGNVSLKARVRVWVRLAVALEPEDMVLSPELVTERAKSTVTDVKSCH